MEGRKSLFPDGISDAARKKPAVSERCEEDQEASTSRRPEAAYPEDGRAARDQQRQWGPRYEERLRYSAETKHDNQYNDEYHGPRAVRQGTRGHAESANRFPNHYNNYRGRPHQRGFRGREFYDGGHYRNDGRPQSPQQQSDNRERQRRSPDQWETVRKPHRNIPPSGSSKGREMHSSQEIDQKFRKAMRELPWLYDRSRVEFKDEWLEEQLWTDVSSACGITARESIKKMKKVHDKYSRLQGRLIAGENSLSTRDTEFIENWKFLDDEGKTTTQNTRPTVSPTANQTQSPPTPRSVSLERLSSSDSGIRTNNPMPDQSFADDFAATIQDWSPEQKAKFKRACCKLFEDFMEKCAL